MIKINFLGNNTGTSKEGVFFLLGSGTVVALTAVILFSLFVSFTTSVSELETQQEDLQQKLAGLIVKTKEVRDLQKKKDELNDIVTSIAELKYEQFGPVRIFSDLAGGMPERLWIREFQQEGPVIQIRGLSTDDTAIASFMKNLERWDHFKGVNLVESRSVYLSQIQEFNAFASKITRFVLPSGEVTAKIAAIVREARRSGLEVREQEPRNEIWKSSLKRKRGTNKLGALSAQGAYNQGVTTDASATKLLGFGLRAYQKDPAIYIWTTLEETRGKAFQVNTTIDLLAIKISDPKPEEEVAKDEAESSKKPKSSKKKKEDA